MTKTKEEIPTELYVRAGVVMDDGVPTHYKFEGDRQLSSDPDVAFGPKYISKVEHIRQIKELSNERKYVYEVRDVTDDERYFPEGIYETPEEALAVATGVNSNSPPTEFCVDEFVEIHVVARPIGGGCDKVVHTVTWQEVPNDDDTDWVWRVSSIDKEDTI